VFDGFFDGVDGSAEEVGVTHFVSISSIFWFRARRRVSGQRVGDGCPLGVGLPAPNAREASSHDAVRDRNINSN
jgi:hypothetical protein